MSDLNIAFDQYASISTVKVCLYRTQPRLGGVREGMVKIKQTKVVHTERDRGTRL